MKNIVLITLFISVFCIIIFSGNAVASIIYENSFVGGSLDGWSKDPSAPQNQYVINEADQDGDNYYFRDYIYNSQYIYKTFDLTGIKYIGWYERRQKDDVPSGYTIKIYDGGSLVWEDNVNPTSIGTTNEWVFRSYELPAGVQVPNRVVRFIHSGLSTPAYWADIDKIMFADSDGFETPPIANFIASQTIGDAPLQVIFTDTSSFNPVSWYWDFGDNTTSTVRNPSHTYTNDGYYNVSLNVQNAMGNDWENKTAYITVGYAPGSTYGYFRLSGTYNYAGGFPTEGFAAELIETDPNDLYDRIVWTLDGSLISDSDLNSLFIDHSEVKNITGTWKSWRPSTATWDAITEGYTLLNTLHPHTSGNHVIGAHVYYNNIQVADLDLTVLFHDSGAFSTNTVYVYDNNNALISGAWVNCTEIMTGINTNTSFPMGASSLTLIKGHSYRFTVSAPGYTTLVQDRAWPMTSGAYFAPFVLSYGEAPSDSSKVYIHARVYNYNTGGYVPGAVVQITYTGVSTSYWTCDNNGYVRIEVPKNTSIRWTAGALNQGYQSNTGLITTTTANYELLIPLIPSSTIVTPTPAPYIPTAAPTLPGGGVYPGYPQYNDEERTRIIEGGIDSWISNLPGLINLIILVCIVTLVGMISTSVTPRRRR